MQPISSLVRLIENHSMQSYDYWVYIADELIKKVLYTGVTNSLSQRIIEHYLNRGTNNSFTGMYYCYWLVYYEGHQYINDAIAGKKKSRTWCEGKKIKL